MFLDDFIDEVGVDAARWYLVDRGPDQTIEIDLDLATEKSQKNPVYYVQYAHARIAAILRNAEARRRSAVPPPGRSATRSSELDQAAHRLPGVVREATERRGPQRSPCTRSGSPTTSTASTTSAASSAIPPRRSASALCRGDAVGRSPAASTSSASRLPNACRSALLGSHYDRVDVTTPRPDRNLALELVRVTEAAAMGAGRWIGRGDKIAADQAAVDAMRAMLDTVGWTGVVVIGEGEKDEAPMLFNGERGRRGPRARRSTSPSTRSRGRG